MWLSDKWNKYLFKIQPQRQLKMVFLKKPRHNFLSFRWTECPRQICFARGNCRQKEQKTVKMKTVTWLHQRGTFIGPGSRRKWSEPSKLVKHKTSLPALPQFGVQFKLKELPSGHYILFTFWTRNKFGVLKWLEWDWQSCWEDIT